MSICKNMSSAICAYKKLSGKTYAEIADQLEISPSALKGYASGKGNPSAAMIERLAHKMGVETSFLVSGLFTQNQIVILKRLLDMVGLLTKVAPENREQFAELFLQIVRLLDAGDTNA